MTAKKLQKILIHLQSCCFAAGIKSKAIAFLTYSLDVVVVVVIVADSFSCRNKKLSSTVWALLSATLHLRDGRGAASLRYRNRSGISVVKCEQKPYPVFFSRRRKSVCEDDGFREQGI